MANPYRRPDPNEELEAFGGQLPPSSAYSGLSDYLRGFSAQQGSTLPASGASNPVIPLTATARRPALNFQAALEAYADGRESTPTTGLPIQPRPTGLDLEAYAAGRGPGAYPGAPAQPAAPPMAPYLGPSIQTFTPTGQPPLTMPPLYGDLQRIYEEAVARSQNAGHRFFDIARGENPNAVPLKLLGAMDTMRRQTVVDQQTAEKHQLDRAIQMDNLAKNERELWSWVQEQYTLLGDDSGAQERFLNIWAPRLTERHEMLTRGSVVSDTLTVDDARAMIGRPGSIGDLISVYQDATPAQLAEARRIYATGKPGERAQKVREYLMGERKVALEQAMPRVADQLSGLIETMTQENGGRMPLIPSVERRAIESIEAAEAQNPGVTRRTFGVSPEMAKDAVRLFSTSAPGKTFYEQRGMRAVKASPSLADLKIGEDLATAITEDPEFQKRGITLTEFGSLPAEEQSRLRVRAQNRLEARKAAEKAEGRTQAAADKEEAERNKVILDPSQYVDVEHLKQTGEVKGPEHEITKGDVQSLRYRKVTPKQREAVGTADQGHDQAATIFSNAEGLITADTPAQALSQKVQLETGAFTNSNPEARLLKGQIEAISNLARALGERGVLTDQDIKRIQYLLPSFGDTAGTLALKKRHLLGLFETARQIARATMLGEDLSRYRKRLRVLGEEADRAMRRPAGVPERLEYEGAERG